MSAEVRPGQPMFPLEQPILPQMMVPLNVFEPRYLALLDTVLGDEEPGFGTVMIARGREVGGGEMRTDRGVWLRVVRAEQHGERRALLTVAVAVLRVARWVEDAPFPRADVVLEPLHPADLGPPPGMVAQRLITVMEQAAELGERAMPGERDREQWVGLSAWQAAALSPLGAADRHALLGAAPGQCWATLERLLAELEEIQRFRLR